MHEKSLYGFDFQAKTPLVTPESANLQKSKPHNSWFG